MTADQPLIDEFHDLGTFGNAGSSPDASTSSPTVAALKNRTLYNAASQNIRHAQNLRQHDYADQAYGSNAMLPTKRALQDATIGQSDKKRRKTDADTQRPGAIQSFDLHHAPPVARGIQLICTSQMPDRVSIVFPYEVLNAVQSKCFPTAFESNDNLVVSAPTGSGKTVIMELAICRLVMQSSNADFKVVYQAPTKGLCSERYQDWSRKFKLLGLECAELTGDTANDHLRQVQQASIIITTPEKWDSITRKWRDNRRLVEMIRLFLVDEVHILKDQRGATLEAVVSRMKSIGTNVRFVALSATVPNLEDIASWLGKSPDDPHSPARREVFDESFRPVKLDKHVYGFQYGNNDFGFDGVLRKKVPEMIMKHSKKKATMIFCMTRKSAAQTAQALAEMWRNSPSYQSPWPGPTHAIAVGDAALRSAVQAGVAFHHGGLSAEDRHAVEQGFLQGSITVICSTSTLAVGVNLPCYLVILQGTTTWAGNAVQSYSDLEVMQMLGRAGRPQFETSACAVILTREQHVCRYQKMVTGQELLESTLHVNLIEHMNAEIGLGTIADMSSAQKWLSSTFLRVRAAQNPAHYRLEDATNRMTTDELMRQWCEKDIQALLQANMIEEKGRIRCTELGEAMAKYYVNFETMKIFTAIPPKAKLREILTALTQATEFSEMRLRSGEKSFYKELNKKAEIIFPINVDVALSEHKTSIILQAEFGGASLPDGDNYRKHYQQHSTDRLIIFSHANRLIRCIVDCQIYMKDAVSVRNALELARCVAAKVWESTPRQLKQVPEIGDVLCRKLASRGINSIEKLLTKEPEQIEMALNKTQPFGTRLMAKLESYPRLHVSVKEMGRQVRHGHGVTLNISATVGFLNTKTPAYFNKTPVYVCFIAEDSNGNLIDFRRFAAKKLEGKEPMTFKAHIEQPTIHIRCRVMCDEIVGTATYADAKIEGISNSVFPIKAQTKTTLEPSPAQSTAKPSEGKPVFEDGGIDDADLLAATEFEGVEIVDDIDQLPQEAADESVGAVKGKQKESLHGAAKVKPAKIFKEPKQLPNGRWTCQHDCRETGAQCKHECCRDGVIKPRKKPAAAAKATESDTKQRKITGMNGMQAKGKTVNDSQPEKENREMTEVERIMASYRMSQPSYDIPRSDTRAPASLSPHILDELADIDDLFDDEDPDDIFDATECDWNVGRYSAVFHGQCTSGSNTEPRPPFKSAEDPPLNHVSLKDIQRSSEETQMLNGPDTSLDAPQQSVHVDTHSKTATANVAKGLGASEDNEEAASDLTFWQRMGKENWPSEKLFKYIPSRDSHPEEPETPQEKEKRLFEEDQRRRWDGLPLDMYEEFHGYVQLVDEH